MDCLGANDTQDIGWVRSTKYHEVFTMFSAYESSGGNCNFDTTQHGKVTAGPGPRQDSVLDDAGLDTPRRCDVIGVAQAQLALVGEARGVSGPSPGDEEGVLGAAGDLDHGAQVRDRRGAEADARLVPLVGPDQRLVAELAVGESDAQRSRVEAAPRETFAAGRHSNRVVGAAVEDRHASPAEFANFDWIRKARRVPTGGGGVAGLPVAIEAPSPDIVLLVNSEAVELSRGDVFHASTTDTCSLRPVAVLVAAKEATAKLVLVV